MKVSIDYMTKTCHNGYLYSSYFQNTIESSLPHRKCTIIMLYGKKGKKEIFQQHMVTIEFVN